MLRLVVAYFLESFRVGVMLASVLHPRHRPFSSSNPPLHQSDYDGDNNECFDDATGMIFIFLAVWQVI